MSDSFNFLDFLSKARSSLRLNVNRSQCQLCEYCRKLELSKTNINREPAKYSLGPWKGIKRRAEAKREQDRCPFCTLVRMFAVKHTLWYEEGEATIEWKAKGGFYLGTEGDNISFLFPESTSTDDSSGSNTTATTPFGSARIIQPQIDPKLIARWLRLCEVHHEKTCQRPSQDGIVIKTPDNPDGMEVLRLIDVKKLCIVQAGASPRYVALSYVWGQVIPNIRLLKENLQQLSSEGGLGDIRDKLPRTINDAIDLVAAIGEQYLWVDSLCLVQDDAEDMRLGISKMDLVYRCAVFTVVSAHALDANAPLPGLHPGTREVKQFDVEVAPGVRMTSTTGVYNVMQKGKHIDRGWTVQEVVLSYRILVFSESCIYFRCRQNCWSEDTLYDHFPSATNEILHSGGLMEFLADDEENPLFSYSFQLMRYTARELSRESDSINAFTGILRRLCLQAHSGLLEGLPTVFFDFSLLFWGCVQGNHRQDRRVHFPSWSWAGWYGIQYGYGGYCDLKDANMWLETRTYIVWWKQYPGRYTPELVWDPESPAQYGELDDDNDGDVRQRMVGYRPTPMNPYGRRNIDTCLENVDGKTNPDDDYIEENKRSSYIRQELDRRNYPFLDFFAHVVQVLGFGPWDTKAPWARVWSILGSGGTICGGMKLDDAKMMMTVPGPYDLVILSSLDRYESFFDDGVTHEKPIFWVMLIVWMDTERTLAERRGIGYLFQDFLQYTIYPGKVWKEIVLA